MVASLPKTFQYGEKMSEIRNVKTTIRAILFQKDADFLEGLAVLFEFEYNLAIFSGGYLIAQPRFYASEKASTELQLIMKTFKCWEYVEGNGHHHFASKDIQ